MRPITAKYRRRDSRDRYKGYPYANKKYVRRAAAHKARRLRVMCNAEYRKAFDVWWTIW